MSTLHDAIRRIAHGWMMKLIADGADVSKEMDGYTPLQLAARCGELESINILLDSGADLDGLNCHPLREAFSSQHYTAVVSLLAHGASVPDDDYRLPDKSSLMSAMDYGWIDVAKAIIRRMEDRPGRSQTLTQALLKAIPMNSKAGNGLALLLISKGAEVTYPLHDAAREGNIVVSKYLIASGADVNAVNIASEDGGWRSPLHLAARYGYSNYMDILLDNGADVDEVKMWQRLTWSSNRKRPQCKDEAAMLLLSNSRERTRDWFRTFYWAMENGLSGATKAMIGFYCMKGHKKAAHTFAKALVKAIKSSSGTEVALLLIANGADVRAEVAGLTPLDAAYETSNAAVFRALVAKGAGLKHTVKYRSCFQHYIKDSAVHLVAEGLDSFPQLMQTVSRNPLWLVAYENRNYEAFCYFVRGTLELVDAATYLKRVFRSKMLSYTKSLIDFEGTILDYAVLLRDIMTVNHLISRYNVDVNAPTVSSLKRRPIHVAAMTGTAKAIKLLLATGASLDVVDDDGNTPRDVAVENGKRMPVSSNPPWLVAYENRNYEAFCYLVRGTLELVDAATYLKRVFRSKMLSYTKSLIDFEGTILDYAVLLRDIMTVNHLISRYNVDVNAPTVSSLKRRPIHVAAMTGTAKTIKLLVATGASPDVVDDDGITPRDIAVENGKRMPVSSNPPWLVAYENRNYKAFCYLVRGTLELVDAATYLKRVFRSKMLSYTKDLIDFEGTILDYAVLLSDTMTVNHLIGHYNVDVNAPTVASLKRRPIHVAAMTGTAKAIKFLVATGASPDVVDDDGNTPRDVLRITVNPSPKKC